MNEHETNSGAAAKPKRKSITKQEAMELYSRTMSLLPYRLTKKYIGEVEDQLSLDEMENMARFAGGDFALELRGERLHLFRLLVREVS